MLTNVGFSYQERAKVKTMENTIEPLFAVWKEQRQGDEAFGPSARALASTPRRRTRRGTPSTRARSPVEQPAMVLRPMFKSDANSELPGYTSPLGAAAATSR